MLEGKIAIVTGGGSGIGEAIGRLFQHHGCKVILCGRRRDRLARIADEIEATAIVVDVSSESEVAAAFAECNRRFGRLDILVNNAAVGGPTRSIEQEDSTEWDEVFAINVRGMMLCMKYAVPLLKQQGGAIINLSSDAVLRPKAHRACYAASKFAVIGLTKAVAQEVGKYSIRVNAILPGATDTEMLREVFQARALQYGISVADVLEQSKQSTALSDIAKPGDIAAAALYLAAESGRAVTGTTLVVDAGRQ